VKEAKEVREVKGMTEVMEAQQPAERSLPFKARVRVGMGLACSSTDPYSYLSYLIRPLKARTASIVHAWLDHNRVMH
jgi:hypothetical protein